jgi:uncharacterized membrane protein YhaH (DUF805 family)
MKFQIELSPHGRASRKQYATKLAFSLLIAVANALATALLSNVAWPHIPEALRQAWTVDSICWTMIGIWPAQALVIRRLHDIGATGWWGLLMLIPIVNFFVLGVLLLRPGQPDANRHGPSPLALV